MNRLLKWRRALSYRDMCFKNKFTVVLLVNATPIKLWSIFTAHIHVCNYYIYILFIIHLFIYLYFKTIFVYLFISSKIIFDLFIFLRNLIKIKTCWISFIDFFQQPVLVTILTFATLCIQWDVFILILCLLH